MNRSPFAQVTSRLGPGLKGVLAMIAVVGLLEALLVNWVGLKEAWLLLACFPGKVLHGQVWRLLTAGVLTDISHPMGLLFTLVGLYFLSPDLEKRWGTGRFLLFLALSTVLGNALAIVVDLVTPDVSGAPPPPDALRRQRRARRDRHRLGGQQSGAAGAALHDLAREGADAHLDHDRRLLSLPTLPRGRDRRSAGSSPGSRWWESRRRCGARTSA